MLQLSVVKLHKLLTLEIDRFFSSGVQNCGVFLFEILKAFFKDPF